ncbi:hypothetical protein [Dietzia sp. 179-F 9C3 NHS]|uniref:hypothetical protein n=1 Tax=Dietzia sp. 179-F 9C3 NHS TaxID=3374295 RepID=UPI00387A1984
MAPDLRDPGPAPETGVSPDCGRLTRWQMTHVQDATAAWIRQDSEALLTRYPHIGRAVEAAKAKGRNREAQARAARAAISATPDLVARAAAERGDRVHEFAEAIGKWQLGAVSAGAVDDKRDVLDAHGEGAFADVLMDFWQRWDIQAVANEVTVWNHGLQVAGTLDIVFRAAGRLYVGDFKTKDDRHGLTKPLSPSVGMQLLNALHADEHVTDTERGVWESWPYARPDHLLAIAVSPSAVVPQLINPDTYDRQWATFTHLRGLWQSYRDGDSGSVLRPAQPPPSAARWPDGELVGLPDGVGAGSR